MPHIQLPEGMPGIVGELAFRPETAKPLLELAEVLLRGLNTLTPAERELIATYVSYSNDCTFCQLSHGAAAAAHLHGNYDLVEQAKLNPEEANISGKLKALLRIAGKVQQGGKHVNEADVARAREQGASDKEIHDTVLIAAAFCMYNRYVDAHPHCARSVVPSSVRASQFLAFGVALVVGDWPHRWTLIPSAANIEAFAARAVRACSGDGTYATFT
jgi:uncharacterized peroxidase-related enzyme